MSTDAEPIRASRGERQRRRTLAALNAALADKQCRNCATVGVWKAYDKEPTHGRVRYVKCGACGHNDQITVIVSADEPPAATPTGELP